MNVQGKVWKVQVLPVHTDPRVIGWLAPPGASHVTISRDSDTQIHQCMQIGDLQDPIRYMHRELVQWLSGIGDSEYLENHMCAGV
jgi:hypothetical protein